MRKTIPCGTIILRGDCMNGERFLTKTREYVLQAMRENDSAHDDSHIYRVEKIAVELARKSGADLFRTQMLALLHEMNDDKLKSNVGVATVVQFLESLDLPKADVDFLAFGIPYISFRKHPKLAVDLPLEIRIVQDADRIDAMGAVGVARTFAYGGAHHRSLENSLAHFDEKLLHLYELLSTEAGKEFAKPRYEFLQAFYRQFKSKTL